MQASDATTAVSTSYIEIVHVTYAQASHIAKLPVPYAHKHERIKELYDEQKARYILDLQEPLQHIPKDNPIILGGAVGSVCVKKRAASLQAQGFQDVSIDDKITIYMEDFTSFF